MFHFNRWARNDFVLMQQVNHNQAHDHDYRALNHNHRALYHDHQALNHNHRALDDNVAHDDNVARNDLKFYDCDVDYSD